MNVSIDEKKNVLRWTGDCCWTNAGGGQDTKNRKIPRCTPKDDVKIQHSIINYITAQLNVYHSSFILLSEYIISQFNPIIRVYYIRLEGPNVISKKRLNKKTKLFVRWLRLQ